MKKAKKLLALLLALAMVCALSVTAFAAGSSSDPDEDPGSITITNAITGTTYYAYKVFDLEYATTASGSISGIYSTNNAELLALLWDGEDADSLAEGEEAYAAWEIGDDHVCPFVKGKEVDGKPGYYYVTHIDREHESPGRGWLQSVFDTWSVNVTPYEATGDMTSTADFPEVDYGYYYITDKVGSVVTVDQTTPHVDVVDKNPRTPGDPEKTEDKLTVAGGEEVTFTSHIDTTNYYSTGGSNASFVTEYRLKDHWTDGLTFDYDNLDDAIDSVQLVYTTKDEDGNVIEDTTKTPITLTRLADKAAYDTIYANENAAHNGYYWLEASTDTATGDDAFVIHFPWADWHKDAVAGGASQEYPDGYTYTLDKFYYADGVRIKVVYKMKANDAIFDNARDLSATNTVKFDAAVHSEYTNTSGTAGGTKEDKTVVYAFGLSLRKLDGSSTKRLFGAEFVVSRPIYAEPHELSTGEKYDVYTDGTDDYYLIPAHEEGDPAELVPDQYFKIDGDDNDANDELYEPPTKAASPLTRKEVGYEYYQLGNQKMEDILGTEYPVYRDAAGNEYYKNGSKYYHLKHFTEIPADEAAAIIEDLNPVTYNKTVEVDGVEYDVLVIEGGDGTEYYKKGDDYYTVEDNTLVEDGDLITDLADADVAQLPRMVEVPLATGLKEFPIYMDGDGNYYYYINDQGTTELTDDVLYRITFDEEYTGDETLTPVTTNKLVKYDADTHMADNGRGQTLTASWVSSEAEATRVTADNSYDTMDVIGIKEGVYYIKEVKAPAGYKLPEEPFKVTVTNNGLDADGKATTEAGKNKFSSVASQNGNDEAITIDDTDSEFDTVIINNASTGDMPTTGGKGTVALVAFGALAFLGTGVILVTKKRMYNAG